MTEYRVGAVFANADSYTRGADAHADSHTASSVHAIADPALDNVDFDVRIAGLRMIELRIVSLELLEYQNENNNDQQRRNQADRYYRVCLLHVLHKVVRVVIKAFVRYPCLSVAASQCVLFFV